MSSFIVNKTNSQTTEQIRTALFILQRNPTQPSYHHMLTSFQTSQILNLHCPSTLVQDARDTHSENLPFNTNWCTTVCQNGRQLPELSPGRPYSCSSFFLNYSSQNVTQVAEVAEHAWSHIYIRFKLHVFPHH